MLPSKQSSTNLFDEHIGNFSTAEFLDLANDLPQMRPKSKNLEKSLNYYDLRDEETGQIEAEST